MVASKFGEDADLMFSLRVEAGVDSVEEKLLPSSRRLATRSRLKKEICNLFKRILTILYDFFGYTQNT